MDSPNKLSLRRFICWRIALLASPASSPSLQLCLDKGAMQYSIVDRHQAIVYVTWLLSPLPSLRSLSGSIVRHPVLQSLGYKSHANRFPSFALGNVLCSFFSLNYFIFTTIFHFHPVHLCMIGSTAFVFSRIFQWSVNLYYR